jgi:short-subunit dehydrogenase
VSAFQDRYGPWAVVAGASEGLGEAFARALASRGLNLILVARRPGPLESLAQQLREQHKVEVRALSLDLSTLEAPDQLAAAAQELDLGLLVYNAALAPSGPFHATKAEDHARLINVNCRSPMLLSHRLGARPAAASC